MGKMSLGLDDRSARLISGKHAWTQIKDLLAGHNDIQAAIAFVGSDADHFLPLRGPATIVVNAGDEALRNGWTDPTVLLRWTRRGVRVRSLPSLHAKAIVVEGHSPFVLVGSADVLSASGRALDEAVLVADEKQTVDELREAVAEWARSAGEPLTDAWLQEAALRYRPAVPHRYVAPPTPAAAGHGPPSGPFLPSMSRPTLVQPYDLPSGTVVSAAGPSERAVPPAPTAEPAVGSVAEPAAERPLAPSPPTVMPATLPASVGAPAAGPATDPAHQASAQPPAPQEPAPQEPAPQESAQQEPAGTSVPVDWPRPKFIYLATLTRDGHASGAATDQLERLRAEFRQPADLERRAVLEVEMFWWDAASRTSGRSTASYREGWHVVPIAVAAAGRPAVLSPVHSPGRVLHSFTDYAGGTGRTYYYLLSHAGTAPTTFRALREALTAVGEKPSYDHAYMMQHKVAAILDLWPHIGYTD